MARRLRFRRDHDVGDFFFFLTVASTLKVVLAVSGIFVAGAITGGFICLRVADQMARQKRQVERVGPGDIGAKLAEQLRLTPAQKEKVKPIFAHIADELKQSRRDSFNQTAALIVKMDEDLAKELTPAQQTLLKEIRAKEEERRKQWIAERTKRNDGRAPGGGPVGPGEDGGRPPGPPPAPTP